MWFCRSVAVSLIISFQNNSDSNLSLLFSFQAMSFAPTIRDFFLREENYKDIKMPSGDISFILGIFIPLTSFTRCSWHSGLLQQFLYSILLAQRFGELLRKLWNPRNFKAHVSPHEMLQVLLLFFLITCLKNYMYLSVQMASASSWENRVQSLVGPLLKVLKELRRKSYLYIDISKCLDFRVFSDKDVGTSDPISMDICIID